MKRKDISALLDQFETKYDVEKWRLYGVDIWPIVKFDIFMKWRKTQYTSYDRLLRKNTPAEKTNKFLDILKSFVSLLGLLIRPVEQRQIVFSGSYAHRIDYNNKFVNRYFMPLANELRESDGVNPLYLEYGRKSAVAKYDDEKNIIFIEKYLWAAKIVSRFRKTSESQLNGFDAFVKEVDNAIPGLLGHNYKTTLDYRIKTINAYALIFGILFRKYRPRFAFQLCYYAVPMYAMNVAAIKSGVITVDMQHGGIGTTHPAYNNFSRVPASGYNTVPQYFWCWDKPTENILRRWIRNQHFHKTIIGGNPWLKFYLSKGDSRVWPDKRKIILYTMQLNLPEDFIIEAIKKSPKEYAWWLRMHPRTLQAKKPLVEFLMSNGVFDKVNLEEATALPLAEIMLNSVIHISRSSGSVIEATQLGIKTLIIHEIGLENYMEYVKTNDAVACLAETSDEILNAIQLNERKNGQLTENGLIEYKSVLKDLLKNNSKLQMLN